jgi:DNA-directed RNA polymerase specialized sigma24 family protein
VRQREGAAVADFGGAARYQALCRAQLPAADIREVILLRDIEELSIDEIGAVLPLTRESVKARIHRARLMIREYLIKQ